MLPTTTAAWLSLAICVMAAVIEGLCAGRNVRQFFEQVQVPRYSAPLWVWSIIGAIYYLVFGFLLYRILSRAPPSPLAFSTLVLIGVMMLGNALSNLVIFRARALRRARAIGHLYALLDVTLVFFVARLDSLSAWALAPYLMYRVYAVWWGNELARLNPEVPTQNQASS